MKNTISLYSILFEQEEKLSLDLDSDIKAILEPLDKKVSQLGKDIKPFLKKSGVPQEEPTNARSTRGTTQTTNATTEPKGVGAIQPAQSQATKPATGITPDIAKQFLANPEVAEKIGDIVASKVENVIGKPKEEK